jgi:hypothetical protein
VRKGDDLTTFILPTDIKVRNLNLPENPKGLLRPVVGRQQQQQYNNPFHFYYTIRMTMIKMGGACGTNEGDQNARRILVEKHKGNVPVQ